MRLALYQPDIPQNAGAALRLAACTGVGVDIIEPCGFVWSPEKLKRAGLDYVDAVTLTRHADWTAFQTSLQVGEGETFGTKATRRLLLLTTKAAVPYHTFKFDPTDTLLLGRESLGVPDTVHEAVDSRLLIPMAPAMRSLNVVTAAAMVLGEALRQTNGFPIQPL